MIQVFTNADFGGEGFNTIIGKDGWKLTSDFNTVYTKPRYPVGEVPEAFHPASNIRIREGITEDKGQRILWNSSG